MEIPMPEETEKKPNKFVETLKKIGKTLLTWCLRYPLAIILGLLFIIAFLFLSQTPLGDKINPGKVLKMLFGKWADTPNEVDEANSVAKGRVEEVGETDETGATQTPTAKIKPNTNPLRDKSKITVENPETGKSEVIHLPSGVKDTDVKKVTHVESSTYVVGVKSDKKKTPTLG
jgi:hypothetical protein